MKTRTVVLVIVLVLAASMSLAGKKISVDDLYGTWVNSDYNDHALNPGKQIVNPDGTELAYKRETDTEPAWELEFTIVDSWNDRKGNLYIKGTWVGDENESGYYLEKLSDSGKVKETNWSHHDYPSEVSTFGSNYTIYYRQE